MFQNEKANLQNGSNGSNGCVKEKPLLAKIEIPSDNPFDLFKEWYKKAQDAAVIQPHALNLATSDGYTKNHLKILLIILRLSSMNFKTSLLNFDFRTKMRFCIPTYIPIQARRPFQQTESSNIKSKG